MMGERAMGENTVACASSRQGIEKAVNKALDDIGFKGFGKDEKIVIKPNVNEFRKPKSGANTDIDVVRAVVKRLVRKCRNITIAEGTSIIGNAMHNFRQGGYLGLQKEFGVKFVDLNKDRQVEVQIPGASVLKKTRIAKTILDADRIVNMPVLKTHILTTITCSLKNMKGCLHAREKLHCHTAGLDEAIVDYNRILKQDLVVVDATTAMQGAGPHSGEPVKLNLIFAGYNPVSVDSAIMECAGIPVERINHLRLAIENGIGPKEYEIIGKQSFEFRLPKNVDWLPTRMHRLVTGLGRKLLVRKLSREKPEIDEGKCTKCRKCVAFCPEIAISFGEFPKFDRKKCVQCLVCVELCPYSAIRIVK